MDTMQEGTMSRGLQSRIPLFFELCLEYVGTRDLIVLQGVSKDFRAAIARWPRLFRYIRIEDDWDAFDDAACSRLLALAQKQIIACYIAGASQLSIHGIERLGEQPNLHTVSLTGCTLVGRAVNSMDLFVALSPKCTVFRLRDSGFNAEDVEALTTARRNLGTYDLDLFICEGCEEAHGERGECSGGKDCNAFADSCKDCAMYQAIACPNCKDMFCETCATWQGNSNGFSYCQGKDCHAGLCFDCSCWKKGNGMSWCSNSKCNKCLCFDCACWKNGEGMTYCNDCDTMLCFECSCWGNGCEGMSWCSACNKSRCFDCSCSGGWWGDAEFKCYGC